MAPGAKYFDMGKNKKIPKEVRAHSHVPTLAKGLYQLGSNIVHTLDYDDGPKSWGGAMARIGRKSKSMDKTFFGGSMCGDCIGKTVTGGHDRNIDNRRVCQLCGTIWPGLEPDNDRRGAILAQRERNR